MGNKQSPARCLADSRERSETAYLPYSPSGAKDNYLRSTVVIVCSMVLSAPQSQEFVAECSL